MKKHSGMGSRGVTRPMEEKKLQKKHYKKEEEGKKQQEVEKGKKGHHHMTDEQRTNMLQMHHQQTLWIYWTIILLGFWMVLFPLTFSIDKSVVLPSGGRSVWISLPDRVTALKWSDIISGILLIIFGWRSLTPNRPVSLWAACFVGIWLNLAPVIFWAPTAATYINDTLVGSLVIALTILIPGMPNMIRYMKMGSEVPQGWTYNPSSWPQRWIMIVAGFIGWLVSRYLGAFQLGYIDSIWDPFFGSSSEKVLNSKMSHSLPISDGALGALAYTFEFLMGWMGSPSRWRTMPWMVTFFGILVIPLGLVHIFLVISQPVVVGHWCTFCLLAAFIMLPMIPLEIDEVIAMAQHMKKASKRGESFWRVFWKGGNPSEINQDERTPELMKLPNRFNRVFQASIWGMSFPKTLIFSTLIGVALMIAPAAFGVSIEKSSANLNHLTGALIVVVSVISMGEVVRIGRYLNILLALALIIMPWFLKGSDIALSITNTIAGLVLIPLTLPRGIVKQTYGSWDNMIK